MEYQYKKELAEAINNINMKLGEMIKDLVKTQKFIETNKIILEKISRVICEAVDYTKYMEPFAKAMEALTHPDSIFSYVQYEKELDRYHWGFPHGMEPEELKDLLTKVECEKEFDQYMVKYFTIERVEATFQYIYEKIPRKHIALVKQIQKGYGTKQYALINLALVAIIDDLISGLLQNKDQNTNAGIMRPVIDYLGHLPIRVFGITCFEIMMLSNSIDFIFENRRFSEGYEVNSNKKIRRHFSLHGRRVSNKKIDSLMLINTLCEILTVRNLLGVFRGTLKRNPKDRKEYIIAPGKIKLVEKRLCRILEEAE